MAFPIQNSIQSNPVTGVFGNGQIQMFPKSGTFTVPIGVSKVRVRLWGGGGISGGGGGGFAMKVCDVTPAQVIAVTVGVSSSGTSSFGSFCSATGGANSNGAGGIGTGGDVNYQGGQAAGGAGGGAANVFGDGANYDRSGTSGGGATTATSWGGSGITGQGGFTNNVSTNPQSPASATMISSIDYIGTGGGGGFFSDGWNGGGGGSSNGGGGFPAGGGNTVYASGLLIVEY